MKFDIIVGNPPYQQVDENGNSIAGGGIKLWEKFLRTSIGELLKDNGYLCYITPSSWRNYGNKCFVEIFQTYATKYINILTAGKHFNVGSNFDWYIIQKSAPIKDTTIEWESEKKVIDLSTVKGLPSKPMMFGILEKFCGRSDYFNVQNIQTHHHTREHMSRNQKRGFIYPIKHSGAQELWWSSRKHDFQDDKKVLLSRAGYMNPFYDEGKMGTTQECHFILVLSKKEGKFIIKLLNSKLYKFFVYQSKTSGFNDFKLLNLLPYPKDLKIDFTDNDLYEYFNLTPEEILLIEETIK
jgi:hypothetical protein